MNIIDFNNAFRSEQRIREKHSMAETMLRKKLNKIPPRAFLLGRKPTIEEIYENSASFNNPMMPPDCQLGAVFRIWNKLAAARFGARKQGQDKSDTLAVWLWQMDTRHSLSTRHREVRWNILLAIIALNSNISDDVRLFLDRFHAAWERIVDREPWFVGDPREDFLGTFWKDESPFDLIYWNKKQQTHIKAAIERLATAMPSNRFNADEFWNHIKDQPKADFEKHGAAWSTQYLTYMEQEEAWCLMLDKQVAAKRAFDSGQTTEELENIGMRTSEGLPDWLREEHFEQPIIRDLMTPIDKGVVRQQKEDLKFWMSPSAAIHMLEGHLSDVDDLTAQMKGMFLI